MFTFIHTHRVIKIKIRVKNLVIYFNCCIKNFKEEKPLSGVSKSQVGELVVVADQGKKYSVNSELSRGRDSKFSTRGSNKMLVV